MSEDIDSSEGKPNANRILVTGATGTVGESLVTQLLDREASVRAAVGNPEGARRRFGNELEFVTFDLERPEKWEEALADIDKLFLLWPPGISVSNITEFADVADRVGVDHVVFLSIIGAETIPVLPHRRIEKHLSQTGMAYTFLRSSWFMQNLSEIHRPEIVERKEIFIPASGGRLSFTDARDVAAVASTAFIQSGHRNKAYDLTGPAALDFHEVADVFSDVLGRQIRYANPSRLAFAWHMYQRGCPSGFVAFMIIEYSVVSLGYSSRTTESVETLLGRSPRTVRGFVEDYADIFRPDHEDT